MTDEEPKCPRCGSALKTITVSVPVYTDHQTSQRELVGAPPLHSLIRYDQKEDIADCARCFGAY